MIQSINRQHFDDPELMRLQEELCQAVEQEPERFIERYKALDLSHGGRFINADAMKHAFDDYRNGSIEDRSRLNALVNSAASALSYELYEKMVQPDPNHPERDSVRLVTGIPGAGKSTYILTDSQLDIRLRAVYETTLANAAAAEAKIKMAVEAGAQTLIYVVHVRPEDAFRRATDRYYAIGRDITIDVMAHTQGNLPESLKNIREKFGDSVELIICDNRVIGRSVRGWENADILRSEGNYLEIKEKLENELERQWRQGEITRDWYDKASRTNET